MRNVNRQEGLSEGLEEFFAFGGINGGIDAKVTGEDTVDIAIDDSSRQTEGDAPDGSSGIVAHALEFPDFIEGVREMTKGDNLFGGIVEVAGTTVIAQSLPLA